jgi:hypothetical protein
VVDVAWKVEPGHSFNRHTSGWFTLTHSKDRRGNLHRTFKVVVTAGSGRLSLALEQTEAGFEQSPEGLSPAERRVAAVLEGQAVRAWSVKELGDELASHPEGPLRRETITKALGRLLELGRADQLAERGKYGQTYWKAT